MKYKVGIYGSYIAESQASIQLAQDLGNALAQRDVIAVTGGGSGMPYVVAQVAKQRGAEVWGFTSEYDEEAQKKAYPLDDITTYDKLFYVPHQYNHLFSLDHELSAARDWSARLKYRNLVSTIQVDAGIIVSGGWGTMNEFTNLLYDGKPVGVLLGTGGLADELPVWFPRLRKKSESIVFFHHDPAGLVSAVLQELANSSRSGV